MLLFTLAALAVANRASAAGGAHVVDDASVEEPGTCHLESWATRRSARTGLLVVAPACTPRRAPNLEIGLAASDAWQPGDDGHFLSPTIKYVLRPGEHRKAGIAVTATATWSGSTHRIETSALIVPVSARVSKTVDLNFNGGWLWTRTGTRSAAFAGAQIEWQAIPRLGVMGEAFERTDGIPGGQAGVRWAPCKSVDLDLLVSHGFDGTAHANASLGVTLHG